MPTHRAAYLFYFFAVNDILTNHHIDILCQVTFYRYRKVGIAEAGVMRIRRRDHGFISVIIIRDQEFAVICLQGKYIPEAFD